MMANLTNFINSTAQNLSLFAPVNGMIPSNLSQAQAREFVLSHVVPQRWNGSQLVCGIRLESQTRHFLHVSSVEHVHRRRAVQSSYWQVVNPAFRENLLLKTVSVIVCIMNSLQYMSEWFNYILVGKTNPVSLCRKYNVTIKLGQFLPPCK